MKILKASTLITAAIWLVCMAGCNSAPEKHYPVQAEVISAEPQKKMITIKHGNIPGLMPAMTMSYLVAEPKQIVSLQPGDKINADLVLSDSKGRLEKIVLVEKAKATSIPASSETPATPQKP